MRKGKNSTAERVDLGRHIVADPLICHVQPTFKGTRIMVWQVLDDVAEGRSWDFICNVRWEGRVALAAVAEAVKLAEKAWARTAGNSGSPDGAKGGPGGVPLKLLDGKFPREPALLF